MRMTTSRTLGRAALSAALAGTFLLALGACKGSKPEEQAATPSAPAGPSAAPNLPPVAAPAGRASFAAKPGPAAVAVVNGVEISDRMFADDLAAASLYAKAATLKGRREVLDWRIDTILKIQDARRLGIPERPMVARMVERLRRRAVAGRVRAEIFRKVGAVSAADADARLGTLPETYDLTVLVLDTREDAEAAIRRVRGGEEMAKVAADVNIFIGTGKPNPRRLGHKLGAGMYPPEVDEAIAALPIGELSPPFETFVGFLVLRVDARHAPSAAEIDRGRQNAQGTIAQERFTAERARVLKERGARLPQRIIAARLADVRLPEIKLNPAELWRQLEEIRIAEVDGKLLTAGDLFYDVRDYGRFLQRNQAGQEESFLSRRQNAVEEVLLAAEGAARGLDRGPEIEQAVAEYRDAVLEAQYVADIVLGVTEAGLDPAGVRAYYEENKARYPSPDVFTLSLILVRREDEAEAVRRRLKQGGDFATIARELSVDPSAKAGGDLGKVSATELETRWNKEMAADLVRLAKGGERGPLTLRSTRGYHVLLIRNYQAAGFANFEAVQGEVRVAYQNHLRNKAVKGRVAELRAVATIGVDEAKVAGIEPSAAPPPSGGTSPHGAMGKPRGASPHGASMPGGAAH